MTARETMDSSLKPSLGQESPEIPQTSAHEAREEHEKYSSQASAVVKKS